MAGILGLDLGSHSIKAVELRPKLRGVEVVQLRSERVSAEAPLAPELLRSFVHTHRISTESVVCALPGDRVSIRSLRFPFRDRRKITQALPFEVESQTPFELDQVLVDWLPTAGDQARTDVAAVVAPRSEVGALLERLREAGIDPRVVEAEGLVLGNLDGLLELPGTRLLIDLGHRKTTLCLSIDGRPVAARTVPIGGRAITEAIASERRLAHDDAELAKCEQGVFPSGADPGARGGIAVVDRLAREVARSLGAFEPLLLAAEKERVEELTLFGGTAHLHRIDEYLSERVGIPARRLALPADPSLVAQGDPLVFAQGLALALRGTSLARTRMNFRKGEFSQRIDFQQLRSQFRVTTWLAAAVLLLALLATGTQLFVYSRRAETLEGLVARSYAEALPGRPPPANAVSAMRDAVREAESRADFLGVYGGNLSALDILTELAAHVPKEIDVVVEELRIEGRAVRIRGFARDVQALDRLEAALARYERFSQVKVDDIQDDARRSGYSFHLNISLAGSGDAA